MRGNAWFSLAIPALAGWSEKGDAL